jgi:hypothetical protein
MPLPKDIDGLSPAELKGLVVKLLERVAELERTVAAQRDEIARLKGDPPRPNVKPNSKPSGMEQATDPKPPGGHQRKPRGSTRSKLSIDEERNVKLAAPPRGSHFKGYISFIVQDLVIHPHVVSFRCERWQTLDGQMMTTPLPAGIDGHFGPQLRRFVLAQYHQGQTTVPRLVTLLHGRHLHLQAPGGPPADRRPGWLLRRSSRCAPRRPPQCRLDHGGRHRRSPQGRQRLLHPDRQRTLRLVRHLGLQEPPQLPRVAARRPWRLRRQ